MSIEKWLLLDGSPLGPFWPLQSYVIKLSHQCEQQLGRIPPAGAAAAAANCPAANSRSPLSRWTTSTRPGLRKASGDGGWRVVRTNGGIGWKNKIGKKLESLPFRLFMLRKLCYNEKKQTRNIVRSQEKTHFYLLIQEWPPSWHSCSCFTHPPRRHSCPAAGRRNRCRCAATGRTRTRWASAAGGCAARPWWPWSPHTAPPTPGSRSQTALSAAEHTRSHQGAAYAPGMDQAHDCRVQSIVLKSLDI